MRSRVGALLTTEIGRNAFNAAVIITMTHLKPKRWPNLCDYHDRPQIYSHWPLAQGEIYSLPPAMNIEYWWGDPITHKTEEWNFGTRLWSNIGRTWGWKETRWYTELGDTVLELKGYSIKRPDYWEFSLTAYLRSPDWEVFGSGQLVKPYATAGYQQSAPWQEIQHVLLTTWFHPIWHASVVAYPVRLNDMWPEEPRRLTDGTKARSTVAELSRDGG